MAQFHFDPATYLEMVRAEVPHYDTLQSEIGRAARRLEHQGAPRVLDLGAGTGSTAKALLDARPDAQLVLVDENPGMLAVARDLLPPASVERVVIADLSDPLPEGPFDLVVSVLAIHHLDGAEKRALFAAVNERLRSGGRFAMADVILPEDPADAVVPLSPGYDKPDRADNLPAWLQASGFHAEIAWARGDLAVFIADR